jgi:TonB-linked SusC/RagA family outer membrane protein
VTKPNDVLLISFIGYASQEISVGTKRNILVRLKEKLTALDEIVVVGYGSQKKINLTGAVGTVDLRDIEGKPSVNIVEALQGTIPGLIITQSTSKPGNRPGVNIRGLNTLNDNNPLIIIDGIQGDIQNINQSDIEQISVLKDASAAIYGSRASNGVILITTKQGSSQKNEVRYESQFGWQQATELPAIINPWEYAELRNEALINSGRAPEFTADQIANYRYGDGSNTKWIEAIYKPTAPMQSHSISMNGGNSATTYLLSAGYLDQKSLFRGDNFGLKRYNFRLNIAHQLSERFKFSATTYFTRNENRTTSYWEEWIIEQATRTPSIYNMKEGNEYMYPAGTSANPLARLEKGGYSLSTQDDINGTIRGEFKIINGLTLVGMGGVRITGNRTHENRIAIAEKTSNDLSNFMSESYGRTNDITVNVLLNYEKSFGKHSIAAFGGYAYEGNSINSFYTDRSAPEKDVPYNGDDVFGDSVLGDAVFRIPNSGGASNWALYSAIGRISYNFGDRYLLDFNIRNDISSKFAKGNRSGVFPSLSAAWRVSQENFYGSFTKYVPSLKLRTSWGLLGNNRIDNYQYLSRITVNQGYTFGGLPASTAWYSAANEYIGWETTRMLNFGLDAGLLNNKLNVSFDYFNNMTYDILMNLPVPGTYGGGAPIQNAGKVKTQGWEFNLSYNFGTGQVNHYIHGNISDSWNKVISLKGTESVSGHDPQYILREGYPIWAYYAYRSDGFFQNQDEVNKGPQTSQGAKPGDIRYIDKNGDNAVTPDKDYFILGTRDPRYTFGFSYGFDWKGLDFSMFWQGVGKRNAWLRGEAVEAFHNGNTGPVFEFHKDRWTPENGNATYPRLTVGSESANNALPSDFWIWNAAYLRLKNVQLGYTLPSNLTRKFFVKNLRVYTSLQNAFTFSKMKGTGWDPEYNEGTGRIFPVSRIYSMGLDIKF